MRGRLRISRSFNYFHRMASNDFTARPTLSPRKRTSHPLTHTLTPYGNLQAVTTRRWMSS